MATPMERRAAAAQADDEQTIARAKAMRDGAKLLFDEDDMRSALEAFVGYKPISDHFVG